MKRRIKDFNLKKSKVKVGVEFVKYYELQGEKWKTIILSTNGTMLSTGIKKTKRESILSKIKKTPYWNKISKCIIYIPKKEYDKDKKKIRSYFFTNLLFKGVLAKEYKGRIDQIIFATDYDIAGSFIALSILEKTQYDRSKNNKEEIDESKVRRMILKTLTKTEIMNELDNLSSFDWGNAYGGKLRSVFDFFFGKPLTQMLRNALEEHVSGEESSNLGIGRVQLPALFLVINRDWESTLKKDTYNIYFLLKGYFSKADIKSSLKERDLIAFLTREKKDHYSKSQFLVDFAEKKIGTHTTRLKIPKKLERAGLIEFDNNQRICSTKLGLQYYNILRSRLRTKQIDFASTEFSKRLYEDIEILKNLDQNLKEENQERYQCEQKFNELMKFYYDNIIELIPKFQNEAEKVAPLLADIINQADKEESKENADESEDENPDEQKDETLNYPLRLEAEDCIPPDYVDMLVDTHGKYKKPETDDVLLFYRKFQKTDLLGLLRLLLRIPRDTNFTICGTYQEEYIEKFNEDNCVVFKAPMSDDNISDCIKRFNRILDDLKSLQLESPITKLKVKKKIEVGHEPLHTVNLQHGNIPGEDGKELVREYDRPYIYTIRKLFALSEEKGGLICGFSIKNLKFQSIDPYKPFEAHNYESMLFTMYEKYQWELGHTSDMMQKLYEGGEFY
ncbi:MAG: hypothetical protein PVF58_15455 [Candidatus Methanofastidiosia archaeon]|jgi:hypothetical protein